MTKQDYEKFAKIFADLLSQTEKEKTAPVWEAIRNTCAIFQEDNSRFDWGIFMDRILFLYNEKGTF